MEAAAVLLAIAKELAQQAKDSLPELQDGEQVQHERYEDGVYFRETVLDGQVFLSQYDFRQRASRREAVAKRGEWQSLKSIASIKSWRELSPQALCLC